MRVDGIIDLVVNIGGIVQTVFLNVVERLSTEVILECEYCDKHVEIIRPGQRIVELADATTVPNIVKPALHPRLRSHYRRKRSTNRLSIEISKIICGVPDSTATRSTELGICVNTATRLNNDRTL